MKEYTVLYRIAHLYLTLYLLIKVCDYLLALSLDLMSHRRGYMYVQLQFNFNM